MNELILFGISLKNARKKCFLSQEKTAEIFRISVRWYQMIEAGKASPRFDLLCRMVKFFKIDISKFCPEEDEIGYSDIAN